MRKGEILNMVKYKSTYLKLVDLDPGIFSWECGTEMCYFRRSDRLSGACGVCGDVLDKLFGVSWSNNYIIRTVSLYDLLKWKEIQNLKY